MKKTIKMQPGTFERIESGVAKVKGLKAKLEHATGGAVTVVRNAPTNKIVPALFRQAHNATSRLQLRLIRGKLSRAISHLSEPLRLSAMREFDRQSPEGLPYRGKKQAKVRKPCSAAKVSANCLLTPENARGRSVLDIQTVHVRLARPIPKAARETLEAGLAPIRAWPAPRHNLKARKPSQSGFQTSRPVRG